MQQSDLRERTRSVHLDDNNDEDDSMGMIISVQVFVDPMGTIAVQDVDDGMTDSEEILSSLVLLLLLVLSL